MRRSMATIEVIIWYTFGLNEQYDVQIPIREAINQAIDEEMARDEKVFVMGILLYLCSGV